MKSHIPEPAFPFVSLDFPGRTILYMHEIASRLGCSVDQVYDLTDDGSISAVDIARKGGRRRELRVPIESWRAFVLARMTGPALIDFIRILPLEVRVRLRAELDAVGHS